MIHDRIITSKLVLQAGLELQRQGIHKTLALLESAEPDLAEYVLETSTTFYHDLLRAGLSAKQARRLYNNAVTLALVCIKAQQKAHAELWNTAIDAPLSSRGESLEP